jgi:hypothetical protein
VIQFFSHPAKEPFQIAGRVASAAAVATFLLGCDPVTVLRNNHASGLEMDDIQGRYDFQLRDLLADFAKAVSGHGRAQDKTLSKSQPSPITKGASPCFADLFSLAL